MVHTKDLPDAVPLLPKQANYVQGPPKCPLDSVKFIQLKRFQHPRDQAIDKMNSGFDLVGQSRKLRLLRNEEKIKKDGKLGPDINGYLGTNMEGQ